MMKGFVQVLAISAIVFLGSCEENKVYQEYIDLNDRNWLIANKPAFTFTVADPQSSYNVYWNIRNSTQYPNARIFVNVTMLDSSGNSLYSKLLSDILFEPKTGKPTGTSGLGDLFEHRNEMLKNYKFPGKGPYTVRFEQFMRTDTIPGIISIGLEIEKAGQR